MWYNIRREVKSLKVLMRTKVFIHSVQHEFVAVQDALPRKAVCEAIGNAVCRRDYDSNGAVQMMLFCDRIEVINTVTLPRGWTAATLLTTHKSVACNKVIAKTLDRIGYVARSGRRITTGAAVNKVGVTSPVSGTENAITLATAQSEGSLIWRAVHHSKYRRIYEWLPMIFSVQLLRVTVGTHAISLIKPNLICRVEPNEGGHRGMVE